MATVKGTPIELKVVVPGLPEALQGTTYVNIPAKVTLVTDTGASASASATAGASACMEPQPVPKRQKTQEDHEKAASHDDDYCQIIEDVPTQFLPAEGASETPFLPVEHHSQQVVGGASDSHEHHSQQVVGGASDSLPVESQREGPEASLRGRLVVLEHRERMRALMTDMAGGDTVPDNVFEEVVENSQRL